jgi:hypothetical protein
LRSSLLRWWPILGGIAGLFVLAYILAAIFVLPTWIVSMNSSSVVQSFPSPAVARSTP